MTQPKRYGTSCAERPDGIFCLYAEYEKVVAERDAALLDAERTREERNRVGVEIRREWMAKCEVLLAACRTAVMALAYASKDNPACHPAYQAVSDAIDVACAKEKA